MRAKYPLYLHLNIWLLWFTIMYCMLLLHYPYTTSSLEEAGLGPLDKEHHRSFRSLWAGIVSLSFFGFISGGIVMWPQLLLSLAAVVGSIIWGERFLLRLFGILPSWSKIALNLAYLFILTGISDFVLWGHW